MAAAAIPDKTPRKIEWVLLGLLLTLYLVLVHFHFQSYAGGLWRDEVNSVNYAELPSYLDVWTSHQFDWFPVVWPTLLRTWIVSGFGDTDSALRWLGLVVGLGMLGMFWWTAWKFGIKAPLFSLVLFSLNPAVVIYGDSLRVYGLGVVTLLFMLGSVWAVVRHPTLWTIVLAQVAVLLAAHCIYQNCAIIFAACLGGAAVGILNRNWRVVIALMSIGFVAAVSMLYYFGAFSNFKESNFIQSYSYAWLIGRFFDAIAAEGTFMPWVWGVVFLASLVACLRLILAKPSANIRERRDLAVFVMVTMFVGIVSNFLFLKSSGLPTQVWYHFALMALLAICFDISLQLVAGTNQTVTTIQVTALALISLLTFTSTWQQTSQRMTDIDIIAAKLDAVAAPGDLIVVWPWYCGMTFLRYYDGPAPWMTLPDVGEPPRFHTLYKVFKDKMAQTEPIRPELERIATTLRVGGRVWLVGGLRFLKQGEYPGTLPPAPNSKYGWNEGAYDTVWSRQTAFLIQSRARSLRLELPPLEGHVNGFENPGLWVAEGWQESHAESSASQHSDGTSRNLDVKK